MGNDDKSKNSLEDLQKEYIRERNKLAEFIRSHPDKEKLGNNERIEIRVAYRSIADIAKLLSERHTDPNLVSQFKKVYDDAQKEAIKYGSSVKTQIPTTTLDDVKGLNDVKEKVKDFLYLAQRDDILKHYRLQGGLGILMYGPPGTGKSMVAEAIAHEMKLMFFTLTPADIRQKYVGEGEQAIKALFEELDSCRDGSVLFVDECESIFRIRTGDTPEYESAITSEILQRMNGFGVNGAKRVIIAATNRPDQIDPAYLRFKRFSNLIKVGLPDREATEAIVKSRIKGLIDENVKISDIVDMMLDPKYGDGRYSAADICGILEDACMNTVRKMAADNSKDFYPVTLEMIERACEKRKPRARPEDLALYDNFEKGII